MQKTILILGLLFSNLIFCQYKTVDKKMNGLPEECKKSTDLIANYVLQNFTTEDEKIRAVYYWITSNMSYDVDYDFSQRVPKSEEKTEYILSKKMGVCMHYAQLFNDLANKVGIKTHIIDGYTKKDGKIAWINHHWNVSKIDGTWYMFDSTWVAGY